MPGGGARAPADIVKRVAYLTGARHRDVAVPEGEVPAQDAQDLPILCEAAKAQGVELEIVKWDAPDLAERGFAFAWVRSCWDYWQRLDEFETRLAALEAAGLPVHNPSRVVRWNARKSYLRDLAAHGAPTIATVWAERADPATVAKAFDTLDAAELVLKPQVGAGSRNTIRLLRSRWSETDLLGAPPGATMIQPYLPAIVSAGETSLFYFAGRPAHVILKRPASGNWLANTAGAVWARGEASAAQHVAAERALAAAKAALGLDAPLLYARVDLVEGASGPLVIELELIEPYLFLKFAPEGADVLAKALAEI